MKPRCVALSICAVLLCGHGPFASAGETLVAHIEKVPPYANAMSLLRRLEHGLVFRKAVLDARARGTDLQLFTVDPSEEEWVVILPDAAAGMHGVLAWIPSDDDARIPASVRDAAAAQGMILIAAKESGEGERELERRAALALIGVHWLTRQYPVDPARILVGGEGESANLALRLATGYADLFSGVIAIDGGGAIGSRELAVPANPLPQFIRERSDIVFIASAGPPEETRQAHASFEAFCAGGAQLMTATAERPLGATVRDALGAMSASSTFTPDPACLARFAEEQAQALAALAAAFDNAEWQEAPERLMAVHIRYGGMAEKEVFEYSEIMSAQYQDMYNEAAAFILDTARNRDRFFGKPARVMPDTQPIF